MKYTQEEVGNIIKQVEAATGQRVANYKYISYSSTQLEGISPSDFQTNNQVLYGDFEVGHLGNGDEFYLRYLDNYGNDTLVVSFLGKSDNIGAIKGVTFNFYSLGGSIATFSGILFNLVDVPAPAFRFSFEKTNASSYDVGFCVNTKYGLLDKLGKVYVDFGDGAGMVAFTSEPNDLSNPVGTIPIYYAYAKAGTYTIKVYTEFPVSSIYVSDEFYAIIGAANFILTGDLTYNIEDFQVNYQEAVYNNIDFITSIPSALSNCLVLSLQGNRLTTAQVNAILIHFNNQVASDKDYYLQNQVPPAPPSGAGITAKNALISRGCLVYTD